MKNFIYNSPTRIIFGRDQVQALQQELEEYKGKTILLVYGKSSIIKSGLYDEIIRITKILDITVIEEKGVKPNPDIDSVYSGIASCKEHQVDFVLAAGGGSVIDCAKAIAFGAHYDGDVWDVYRRTSDATSALPLGVVITLAATGTETNGNSVISNQHTDEKRSVAYSFSIPQFAIIDPSYTLTVDRYYTIAGSIDIMMHVLEQYMSQTTHTETSDYMSIGVLRSVIEQTNKYIKGENTYDVRANLSWASTIGLNWILGVDKVGDWATHRLSYAITKEFDTTHGYALSMLFSSWAKVALKYNEPVMKHKLGLLGKYLFNGLDYKYVLEALDELFTSWGAPVKLKEKYDINQSLIESLVDNALDLGNVGTVIEIDREKAIEIIQLSCR